MNSFLKSLAMTASPIRRLIEQRDRLLLERDAFFKVRMQTGNGSVKETLDVLVGAPYSRYALPLDYLPSRDFQPRWGYSKPRIPSLNSWFATHADNYRDFLQLMRASINDLSGIPRDFDERKLPQPAWNGVPYCAFDALALYCMVKKYKPRRYVEIGSGITTCFAKKAIVDTKLSTRVTSIDPEPRVAIDSICDAVVREGLETCDLSIFDELQANDIVLFDGSHRSFMNSDVTVFFIDLLPRLKTGVVVHIHDISLPWDYDNGFRNHYWNEQYLLAVYLMGNKDRLDPLLPTAFICRDHTFEAEFATPMLDLAPYNDGWRGGGAMWFTHKA